MLAGTVQSSLGLQQMQSWLQQAGIVCELDGDEDELVLALAEANIVLRSGFKHEIIAVGDAQQERELLAAVKQLSVLLATQSCAHEFELYDRLNQLIYELHHPA